MVASIALGCGGKGLSLRVTSPNYGALKPRRYPGLFVGSPEMLCLWPKDELADSVKPCPRLITERTWCAIREYFGSLYP